MCRLSRVKDPDGHNCLMPDTPERGARLFTPAEVAEMLQLSVDEVIALVIDARLAGLLAAIVALLLRAPFIVVVLVAAVVAAVLRAAGLAT